MNYSLSSLVTVPLITSYMNIHQDMKSTNYITVWCAAYNRIKANGRYVKHKAFWGMFSFGAAARCERW